MKFSVNKADFFQSLQKVIGVIPQKTTIPILSNVLLKLEDNTLSISGTDLEISITTKCNVFDTEDGGITVLGKRFFDIVRELPDVPITVSSDENSVLTLSTDKGIYKLVGEVEDEYPQIGVEEADSTFSISLEKFSRMVEKTSFAVSNDELRTTLMGVLMQLTPTELRMAATDGHRLAKICDLSYKGGDDSTSVILPTKALQLVTKNIDDSDNLEIGVGENHVTFSSGDTKIFSKVIEGQFPNYDRVIPIDNDLKMFVNRELLMSTVRRISIFSSVYTHQIKFSINPSSLVIQAEDAEVGGEAQESIPVEYSGEPVQIGYNGTYVHDILRHLDCDDVVFHLKDAGSAAIIRPAEQQEDEDLMMLIMPIRISDSV
ncbi:MAG: DNA polymerase III subunit beta [Calditrichaeota bacterium]|nr:MAG: DNA polymerase III subunit beta [Calditrichota bacterium]